MREDRTQHESQRSPVGPVRAVYCGTPAFAVPALRAMANDARFEVVLVVTQPDRPAGRGRQVVMPAVKEAALNLGLPVYQPEGLRTVAARRPLVDADADIFVVAAYGVIFGPKTLAIPRLGCLNLHASILPAYRGASPIAAAVAQREPTTGVTLMRMEAGLDTGPIIGVNSIDITDDDTTERLTSRLAIAGAELAVRLIPEWVAGRIDTVPQPGGATLTRPMTKADGWLDWSRPANELDARVRAMWPWPRAWTTVPTADGQVRTMQIHRAGLVTSSYPFEGRPGTVMDIAGTMVIVAGDGALDLSLVQEPGRGPRPGSILLATGGIQPGTVLGLDGAPAGRAPLVVPVGD